MRLDWLCAKVIDLMQVKIANRCGSSSSSSSRPGANIVILLVYKQYCCARCTPACFLSVELKSKREPVRLSLGVMCGSTSYNIVPPHTILDYEKKDLFHQTFHRQMGTTYPLKSH